MTRNDRQLDISRFDVGGMTNAIQADKLSAYLFSDRGIYRPGDTINIGMKLSHLFQSMTYVETKSRTYRAN